MTIKVVCARDVNHRVIGGVEELIIDPVDGGYDFSNIFCAGCSDENGDPNRWLTEVGSWSQERFATLFDKDGWYIGDDLVVVDVPDTK